MGPASNRKEFRHGHGCAFYLRLSFACHLLENVDSRFGETNKRIGLIDQVIRKIPGLKLDGKQE
jgi:hypothetical protein